MFSCIKYWVIEYGYEIEKQEKEKLWPKPEFNDSIVLERNWVTRCMIGYKLFFQKLEW